MRTIFLDESGYTGQNLLDQSQPVLSMGSLCLEDDVCAEFRNRIFSGAKGAELKYSSLSKSVPGRKMIIDFLQELTTMPQVVKVAIAHKKYGVVAKMVDILIEPAMRLEGVDLYDRGGNIALSNVMFGLLNRESHDKLLNLFQTMMRSLELVDFQHFQEELFKRQFDDDKLDRFMNFFRAGTNILGPGVLTDPTHTLNLAFTLTFTLTSLWRKDISDGESITVVHDASSIMLRNKAIWDAVVDASVPSQEIGYDTRTTVFPIAVTETRTVDSKDSVGVQLADVLAGAAAAMGRALLKNADNDDYEVKLLDLLNNGLIYKYSLWPSDNVTPESLGTVGPNSAPMDNFDDIVRRAKIE